MPRREDDAGHYAALASIQVGAGALVRSIRFSLNPPSGYLVVGGWDDDQFMPALTGSAAPLMHVLDGTGMAFRLDPAGRALGSVGVWLYPDGMPEDHKPGDAPLLEGRVSVDLREFDGDLLIGGTEDDDCEQAVGLSLPEVVLEFRGYGQGFVELLQIEVLRP